MIDKDHLERFLRLNGIDQTSSEEEMKASLVNARWNDNDINNALAILKEKPIEKKQQSNLHKFFNTDEKLSPESVAALLGVEVSVGSAQVNTRVRKKRSGLSFGQVMQICFISLFISAVFVFVSMWYLEIGVFHITMR